MVVEDERIIGAALQLQLEIEGYDVVANVGTADAAVDAAATATPDLILMDINLGDGGDGIEASSRIRDQFRIPMIFLTAYSDPATLRAFLPVCAWCRKARTGDGYWQDLTVYIREHLGVNITHGICEDCTAANAIEGDKSDTGGRESFRMSGGGLSLFREIRVTDDSPGTSGISVTMGRAQGSGRNVGIRTSGDEPGTYGLELVDVQGNVVDLEIEITLAEPASLEAPSVDLDRFTIAPAGGEQLLRMSGTDLGAFTAVAITDGSPGSEGISVAMGTARGSGRAVLVRTTAAEPGSYQLELTHSDGSVVLLPVKFEFTAIRFTSDSPGQDGITVGMGRASNDRPNVLIRTTRATPGIYRVEGEDDEENVFQLDIEVVVGGG